MKELNHIKFNWKKIISEIVPPSLSAAFHISIHFEY